MQQEDIRAYCLPVECLLLPLALLQQHVLPQQLQMHRVLRLSQLQPLFMHRCDKACCFSRVCLTSSAAQVGTKARS
jgi:hypothetical protein